MKVIIYGLGREALFVKDMVKVSHQLLGFVDSYAQIECFAGYKYYKLHELEYVEYDYIVLALNGRKISEEIKEKLVKDYHVKKERIADFFEMYAEQKIDKVMTVCKEKCDGLILGISHAALGINPLYLNGVWKNLANGSEDIFYHYQVIKRCVTNYAPNIENMKYAIIELYDYTIFNYDVSLSNQILFYWSHGGIMRDIHNFAQNKNYERSFVVEMKEHNYYALVTDDLRKERKLLFDENMVQQKLQDLYSNKEPVYLGFNDYPLETQFCAGIVKEPFLPFNMHYMGTTRYPHTIEENIYYLHEIIKLLLSINRNMNIYFLLMPRYFAMEKYHEVLLQSYKEDFESIVKKFEMEYGIIYLNMKNQGGISRNPHFYKDTAHLNYYGGIAFTNVLNNIIYGEKKYIY